jgi:GNAT superfamily N-acetyltransferase
MRVAGADAIRIVQVDGRGPGALPQGLLSSAEAVHRQLRPHLDPDYASQMARILAGGAGMIVAVSGDRVLGVAVFRWFENTHAGRRFYVDDLVTDADARSTGVGAAMLRWLEAEARAQGCGSVELESGAQRTRAHRFYFREGFLITGFSFKKALQ